MSNLLLRDLKWSRSLTTETPFRSYRVRSEGNGKFAVYYESETGEPATGFTSMFDAMDWAENTHYASEMQPYVLPSQTWISVDDRLPEEDGLYFAFYPGSIHERQVISFSSNIKRFNLFHDSVTHWMPLPKPPEGE